MRNIAKAHFTRLRILPASLLTILCLGIPSVSGQQTPSSPERFPDGTRWTAIGDSITHGGSYYAWVYLYYTTRFPDQELHVANCGVSGDVSSGAIRRYGWDITPTDPDTVTIMLGMNDVGRKFYGVEVTPEVQKQRELRMGWYEDNMRKLVKKLKADGVNIILITPSPYDDTAELDKENNKGANAELAKYGDFLARLAVEEDLPLVDFNGPMTELNQQLQADDPSFTLIGQDRVHPGWTGHFVMAYLFLKAQGAPSEVSSVTIDAKALSSQSDNAEITDLKAVKGGLSFTSKEGALPYPIDKSFAPALDYVSFMDDFNREELTVHGLASGKYKLLIDGEQVGTFTQAELSTGINLALLTNTPQYKQAEQVLALVMKWRKKVFDLRQMALIEHGILRDLDHPIDFEKATPILNERLEYYKTTSPNKRWANMIEFYLENKPQQEALRQEITELEGQIKTASQPIPHQYEILPDAG